MAHLTIREQTWATAAMMCLAYAVETEQGQRDYTSIDSPMARALLGKQVDDVYVETDAGKFYWFITCLQSTGGSIKSAEANMVSPSAD